MAIIITFLLSFYIYGATRTMQENVGFDAQASTVSLFAVIVAGVLYSAVVFIMYSIYLIAKKGEVYAKYRPGKLAVINVLVALGGSAISEMWILVDETRFQKEIAKEPSVYLARERAWPHQVCSLVYKPNEGVHATD